ncbi:MAG: Asp-tRNA(Asn)/Glu-tRNA(Gln) amidotransferase subunit GatB [bacterium]|nr:Asp-tRNA(Asn)/Glu-tRNA(Gln) amidotransferase subunit GatB [bacterium]
MKYDVAIGLEIHVELATRTKLFCGCPSRFGAPPNTLVCPICLGLPGSLPVLNRRAVELGILAALALGAEVAAESVFARKNYFYPDLPKGYQISQYERPLATGGELSWEGPGGPRTARIRRVHLEEDAGKSLHGEDAARSGSAAGYSLLDFNRCGVPLIEIVTEPDLTSPEDARAFLETLRQLLAYTDVSDVKLEEGSLRCDANVSLRPAGAAQPGVPVEIKNVNSFRFVQRALAYEIERQAARLAAGHPVARETRQYREATGSTESLRSKEQAHDYRYFPDPDLVPVAVDPEWIESLRRSLPELPEARRARYRSQYGLTAQEAALVTASLPLAGFFEATVAGGADPREAANWLVGELARLLNAHAADPSALKIGPGHLVELLGLLAAGVLSRPLAKEVFEESFLSGRRPADIVQARGLSQTTDEAELARQVEAVLAAHTGPAGDYRAGKERALGFLVGQVMRATGGRANPGTVNRLLRDRLGREG